jgi:gas vesicle protein
MKTTGSFIAGLLAGAAIGGVVTLFFAPQSGEEAREKAKEKLHELEAEFEKLKKKATAKSGHMIKDLADRLTELQKEIEKLSETA